MADDAIEVEFQQTADDIIAFNLVVPRAPKPQPTGNVFQALKMTFIVFLLLAAWHFVVPNESGKCAVFFLAGFVACSFFLLFMCVVGRRRQVSATVKNMLATGENILLLSWRKVLVNNDFIEEKSEFSKYEVSWSGVERVEKVKDYVFIYISSMSAFLIPKRAFADEAAFERFYQTCLEYWNAAKGLDPAAEGAA